MAMLSKQIWRLREWTKFPLCKGFASQIVSRWEAFERKTEKW
jgi:hypothetical protein